MRLSDSKSTGIGQNRISRRVSWLGIYSPAIRDADGWGAVLAHISYFSLCYLAYLRRTSSGYIGICTLCAFKLGRIWTQSIVQLSGTVTPFRL